MDAPVPLITPRPRWQRWVWLLCGFISLILGVVGIVLPLLPTTPFVLLAAFCFSRGSERCDQWLLSHPRFGPMVRDWRTQRALPLRAKQLATAMMAVSSLASWWLLPPHVRWLGGDLIKRQTTVPKCPPKWAIQLGVAPFEYSSIFK